MHRCRHFGYIHNHQNVFWKLTHILNTPCMFLQEAKMHIRHVVQWCFMVSVACGSVGRRLMVVRSLNSSQLDMWVNFMPDSLFTRKYVCLRDYHKDFKIYLYSNSDRCHLQCQHQNTWTVMEVIDSLITRRWESHESNSTLSFFKLLFKANFAMRRV